MEYRRGCASGLVVTVVLASGIGYALLNRGIEVTRYSTRDIQSFDLRTHTVEVSVDGLDELLFDLAERDMRPFFDTRSLADLEKIKQIARERIKQDHPDIPVNAYMIIHYYPKEGKLIVSSNQNITTGNWARSYRYSRKLR